MAETKASRYGVVAMALHWVIAAAILFQVGLGGRMEDAHGPEKFAVFQLHKSVGITILLASLLRLGWRLGHRPPPMPASFVGWERQLARITHAGFYVAMLGLPLTGWVIVSASRLAIPTRLYGVIPWPNLPGLAGDKAWEHAGEIGHGALAWATYGLLAMHVAGALRHQLFSRDEPVLGRMAPGAVPGRWLEPRIALIAAGAATAFLAAHWVRPAPPAAAPPPTVEAPVIAEPAVTPSTPAEKSTSPASPTLSARWRVARGSTISFETAWSGAPVKGRFERWTADILFDPEALDRSRVSVSIDMASAVTGDEQRDAALTAPDWFDIAAHPRAEFTASRFEKTGPDRYLAHGKLALRGVSRPLSLPFRLQIDADKARVRGVTSLDRTAFGVGQGEWTSTDQIPAKVTLSIDLRATRR